MIYLLTQVEAISTLKLRQKCKLFCVHIKFTQVETISASKSKFKTLLSAF